MAFLLSSPYQVWAEEKARRSAGGIFCKDHGESEDRISILTPSPATEKPVL